MKYFSSVAMATALFFSFQSQARSFYKSTFKLSVRYSNIVDGSTDLLSELKVNVRYSDDHDFCQVVVGSDSFDCRTYHSDDHPENVMITMDRGIGAKVVATALANNKCIQGIRASFDRLAIYVDDTIDVEWQGRDFYQQIHDVQPESFHIWMYEMTQGTKY